MKAAIRTFIIILAFLQFASAQATDGNGDRIAIVDILLLEDELHTDNSALEKINSVLDHLAKRQDKYYSEDDFVEYLYYYTHRRLLKSYTEYPTLEETLVDGNYDCLTATTVYAMLLNELNIDHDVIETNYHIYIVVHPGSEKELLIETTDPRNGFIADQAEISASKDHYIRNNLEQRSALVSFDFNLERKIEQKELIGLLYYNQSIKEINNGNWEMAKELASKAMNYYTETRVSTLVSMIDSSVF